MTNKITLGLVGVVLILSVYNTVQISNIKIENVIEQPNRSNTANNTVTPQPNNVAANPNMENINSQQLNPTTIPNNQPNPNQMQAVPAGPTTSIKFKNEVHDFGNVDVESENSYSFEFTNTGTEPLKITNAITTGGCFYWAWPTLTKRWPISQNKTTCR